MRKVLLLQAWIFSWMFNPKLPASMKPEQEKLLQYIFEIMGERKSNLSERTEKKIAKISANFVYFVNRSYPRGETPSPMESAKRNAFLSKPNFVLKRISVGTLRQLHRHTRMSIEDLECALQNYSDWRMREFDKPLLGEVWRAVGHLLGYARHIY